MEDMINVAMFTRKMAKKHHEYFRRALPMIASENLISPLALEMLVTDFHNRYAEGHPGARYYQGNEFVDEVERKAIELAKSLFRAEYVDVRPISGTVANLGVLFALAKPGDKITTYSVSDGAHISTERFGAVGVRGCEPVHYPFDRENMNLDVDGTIKLIKETKPKIALFGCSVYLFPTPLKDLQEAFQEVDCYVWYDAAHVLGLIGGGKFQDPLREGVHVMTGSTHKTLPGPQRGIIIANPKDERMRKKLDYGVFPGVVSNHHLHTMAALTITLAEHIVFGREYAAQIIKNAKSLGQALYERGINVLCPHLGFTESHTLVLDVSKNGGGARVSENLEKANIVVNKNLLPWDDVNKAMEPSGIRIGVQELTRLGMRENDMVDVAEFMKRVIIDSEEPKKVGVDVAEFRKEFTKVHYCFGGDVEAYKYYEIVKVAGAE